MGRVRSPARDYKRLGLVVGYDEWTNDLKLSAMFSNNLEPELFAWAKTHCRHRTFGKDEQLPTRPGLLYFVEQGAVRLVGQALLNVLGQNLSERVLLGFVGKFSAFEVISQSPIKIEAFAHLEETAVIWLYWQDLDDNWPCLRQKVLEMFRYQHQRKLLWLSMLGQNRTIDRLLGFLSLLVEEHGQLTEYGYYIPYPLTHGQIASAISATRVTVTRLMGKLRQQGLIRIEGEQIIFLPKSFV